MPDIWSSKSLIPNAYGTYICIKFLPITAESVLHRVICSSLWCSAAGVPAMRSAVRLGGAGADARGGLLTRGVPVRTVRPRPSGSPMLQLLFPVLGQKSPDSAMNVASSVLRIRIRMFVGHPDPFVRCTDPDHHEKP
jgi:hypothetical protein